jgi:hypothetical protein
VVVDATPSEKAQRFYEDALEQAERASLAESVDGQGEAEEVALLRILLRRALERRPEDMRLMLSAADHLGRALTRRFGLKKNDREEMQRVLAEVIGELRVQVSEEEKQA